MGEEANIKITLVYNWFLDMLYNWLGFITDLWHENGESFSIFQFAYLLIYSNFSTLAFFLLLVSSICFTSYGGLKVSSLCFCMRNYFKNLFVSSLCFSPWWPQCRDWGRALKICKRNWIQVRQSSRFSVFFTMMTLMQGLWGIALNICKSKWIQVC